MTNSSPNHEFLNPSPDLNEAARNHVQALLSSIEAAHSSIGEANDTDLSILDQPLSSIQTSIRSGSLTITSLVRHHIRATVSASLSTHCLTAFPWKSALSRAQLQDQTSSLTHSLPLIGLVFSVKDCIHVAQHPTTLGCSSRITAIPTRSAWIVDRLEALGAILIAKTACPQAMVSNTTSSPLWGSVSSPYGDDYQIGGSSGGEAALVKSRGSALGIGTDMGGSVRQPAALNELFGWKFRSKDFRFVQPQDFATGLPRTEIPVSVCGLLAARWSTIECVLGALGLYGDGGGVREREVVRCGFSVFEGAPEVRSAIRYVVEGRERREVRLIDDNADEWADAWMDTACGMGFDEGMEMIGKDAVIPTSLFNALLPRKILAEAVEDVRRLRESFEAVVRRKEIDVLVVPGYSYGVPMPNGAFFATRRAEIWLQTMNLMDWVAMSVPIAVSEDQRREWREAASVMEASVGSTEDVSKMWPLYRQQIQAPLPSGRLPNVSIQLVAPPGHELQLLAFVKTLVEVSE